MGGRISNETKSAVINSSDIVSIASEYIKLTRRSGNDWWGSCPFHKDNHASFHVDNDKKMYHCFSCHRGGNVINLMMELEQTNFVDTVKALAKRAGIEVKYDGGFAPPEDYKKDDTVDQLIELYERVAVTYRYMLMETEQGKFALDYIRKRGLTDETLEKFKIGYAPDNKFWLKNFLKSKNYSDEFLSKCGLFNKNYPDVSFFIDRLLFPIFNRKGQVIAFGGRVLHPRGENDPKYKNSPEMPHYHKKETLFAFNFAKTSIKRNNKVILCEGYMDCIAYHQCGLDYAVAPLGTAFTEEQIKMLRGFTDNVYLSFDSDSAGQAATRKSILNCRAEGLSVKVIRLKGGKDPAEIMLSYGKENLTAQVNGAILDSDYFLNRLGENYPIDTPEGKAKAAQDFFDYVSVLQSDIQKESCLELLGQTLNLKPEVVKREFISYLRNNSQNKNTFYRNQNTEQNNTRQQENQNNNNVQIKLDAELRGLIAVIADLDQFKVFRSNVSVDDLKNSTAKSLYKILEDCFNENAFSFPEILSRCENESLCRLITDVISSGVYQTENISVVVMDTIKLIKKNNLEEQRDKLLYRIRNYTVVTGEDQLQLNALLAKKMELDKQVQLLSK